MNDKYKLRFFIEWGGMFLWPDTTDQRTFDKFGIGPIEPEKIGVSKQLCEELHALEDEWQTSLDWEYPPDPSPWSEKHFNDFFGRLDIAFEKLCNELSAEYQISFCMDKKRRH